MLLAQRKKERQRKVKIKGKISDKEYLKVMEDEMSSISTVDYFEKELARIEAIEAAKSVAIEFFKAGMTEEELERTSRFKSKPVESSSETPIKRVSQATFIQNLREIDGQE